MAEFHPVNNPQQAIMGKTKNNGEDKYINEYFLKNKVNANISKMI